MSSWTYGKISYIRRKSAWCTSVNTENRKMRQVGKASERTDINSLDCSQTTPVFEKADEAVPGDDRHGCFSQGRKFEKTAMSLPCEAPRNAAQTRCTKSHAASRTARDDHRIEVPRCGRYLPRCRARDNTPFARGWSPLRLALHPRRVLWGGEEKTEQTEDGIARTSSLIFFQMILVISSPSSSTTGFWTTILFSAEATHPPIHPSFATTFRRRVGNAKDAYTIATRARSQTQRPAEQPNDQSGFGAVTWKERGRESAPKNHRKQGREGRTHPDSAACESAVEGNGGGIFKLPARRGT